MLPARRRKILLSTAAIIAAPRLFAQPSAMPRIALLSGGRQSDSASLINALLEGLRALGYHEGRTIEIDARYADYSATQAQRLAAEIAARRPALIVTNGGGIEPAIRLSPARCHRACWSAPIASSIDGPLPVAIP